MNYIKPIEEFLNENVYHLPKYLARYSNHIEYDIKRGWSSWNYGQEGFVGTKEELDAYIEQVENGEYESVWISGFDLYKDDLKDAEFGELYKNYWVLIDPHFSSSLAGVILKSDNLEDAIKESQKSVFAGDGVRITDDYKLVYSINDEIHIFELQDD